MATLSSAPGSSNDQRDEPNAYSPRYIDIGINLADPIFRGIYHGSRRHPDDLGAVIGRAREVGCKKLIVTGSDFKSSRHALELTKEYQGTVFSTIGIHPCSSAIFSTATTHEDGHSTPCDPDPSKPVSEDHQPHPLKTEAVISELSSLVQEVQSAAGPSGLVAFGEFGLDYDRLHYCSKTIQLHSFEAQLKLAASLRPQLPLFLHSRAAHSDFVSLLKKYFGDRLEQLEKGGVVHSFTGTVTEMRELMDLGLYIGVNGCSFKTADNCAVVKEISLDRIMLETDGPWCEVRASHEGWKYLIEKPAAVKTADRDGAQDEPAVKRGTRKNPQKKESDVPERYKTFKKEKWEEGAMVKGRNEPCMIERVAKMVAGIKGVEVEAVCEAAWANTVRVFGLEKQT